MSEHTQQPVSENESSNEQPTNPGRRRLGKLGAGGTAVALTVASRSAVAGWGNCSKSELASGNLSRDMNEANPCGCSPGYWWNPNGSALWSDPLVTGFVGCRPGDMFNTVFGNIAFLSPDLPLSAVGPSTNPANTCGANGNTAMHAVAALLNAIYYGTRYPVPGLQTAADVKAAFLAAFNTSTVGNPNAKKQAFAAFVTRVDVYTSKPTWCQGKSHGGV